MEKFTVYQVHPVEGWQGYTFIRMNFEDMLDCVHWILYTQVKSVKVSAIFVHQSRYLPRREALISFFEVANRSTWKSGDPVDVIRRGASLKQLEEVSHFKDCVPREFYERNPLWS